MTRPGRALGTAFFAGVLIAAAPASAEPLPGQRAAAEAGDARAQFAIALVYDTGTPTNYPEALKWFRLSAEGGYPVAEAKLGLMYLYGWAVKRDPAEAARWYEKAAAHGHVAAQAQIGLMYARGQGVAPDASQAHVWWSRAAASGDTWSAWNLARLERKMTATERAEARSLAARR